MSAVRAAGAAAGVWGLTARAPELGAGPGPIHVVDV